MIRNSTYSVTTDGCDDGFTDGSQLAPVFEELVLVDIGDWMMKSWFEYMRKESLIVHTFPDPHGLVPTTTR